MDQPAGQSGLSDDLSSSKIKSQSVNKKAASDEAAWIRETRLEVKTSSQREALQV